MNMKKMMVVIGLTFGLAVLTGCETIRAPFNALTPNYATLSSEDLKIVAADIEKAVHEGQRTPDIKGHGGIVIDTPEIMQAIRTRAARAELVSKLLSTGFAAEKSDGTIAILRSYAYKKSASSRQKDVNALVVMSENANRWTIYEDLLKASNLPRKNLSDVQDVFYRARFQLLESGQKYEDENGKIVPKP